MSKIFISFEAETLDDLQQLVLSYALQSKKPPSWLGKPLDAEAVQAEVEAREQTDAEDAVEEARGNAHGQQQQAVVHPFPPASPIGQYPTSQQGTTNGADHAPEPEYVPEPAPKRARAPRAPRVSAATPAPVAAPPAPAPDLPPLDTLKSVVTAAVRLAQKGEGSRAILDLLPGFKDTTGLAFIMNAEEKHREALFALVHEAGLPVV